jgi:hypothetical protein
MDKKGNLLVDSIGILGMSNQHLWNFHGVKPVGQTEIHASNVRT